VKPRQPFLWASLPDPLVGGDRNSVLTEPERAVPIPGAPAPW
jgi:hypothetical protein